MREVENFICSRWICWALSPLPLTDRLGIVALTLDEYVEHYPPPLSLYRYVGPLSPLLLTDMMDIVALTLDGYVGRCPYNGHCRPYV